MKIAFTIADLGGCGYYRSLLPGVELQHRGHEVSYHRHTNDPRLHEADIIVAQRISEPVIVDFFRGIKARRPDVKIFLELDDNVHEIPSSNPCSGLYGNAKPATNAIEDMARFADGMIVSTPDLAERYLRFNSRIMVARNCIADGDYASFDSVPIDGALKRPGQVRIGWAGSNTHRADLAMVVKPLSRVMHANPDVRLIFFGDDFGPAFEPGLQGRIEYQPAAAYIDKGDLITGPAQARQNLMAYYDTLATLDLDIAIAPIESTTFNRCKSHIKLLEYGMVGVPTIASRFGPYREYEQTGGHVLTVHNESKVWEAALNSLIGGPQDRERIARANRAHIGSNHLISQGVQAWEKAFESVMKVAA